MGQRHQIFVVARVRVAPGKPRQYRCIAAIHHQWCYGKLPLYAVNSFKCLVRVPENATLIEEELATYHERIANAPEHPCPYTGYLAESAFSVDLVRDSGPYISGVSTLEANMGTRDGDNNDGITVLDVTIPRNPAYCFVSIYGLEAAEQDTHPDMTPLTAAQYLRSYYPNRTLEEYARSVSEARQERYCLGAIANLDDMPLIPVEALAEVWPEEYSAPKDKTKDAELSDVCEADPAHSTNSTTNNQSTPYPADIDAFRKQSALSTEDVARLTTALTRGMNPDVDLSRFPLTTDQILSILKDFPDLTRLDVSHCQAVDRDFLLSLFKTHSLLKRVNILHCPISGDDLKDLAIDNPRRFRSIEAILHPTFLQNPIPLTFPIAFSITYTSRSSPDPINHIGLPFFVVDQLVRNIFDFCKHIDRYATPHGSVLASACRSPDQSWQDRVVPYLPVISSGWKPEKRFRTGYQLVIIAGERKYGILPPLPTEPEELEYTDSDIMGIESFLKRLEEEGTHATDGQAVNRLVELLARGTLLTTKEVKDLERLGVY